MRLDTALMHQPGEVLGRTVGGVGRQSLRPQAEALLRTIDHPLLGRHLATTAASTAARAATRPRIAADRPGMPSLARSACVMKAELSARGSRTPNTTARPRIWFSRVTRWPTSFLRAMISDRTACADRDFT